jgi:hypothetical protein
MRRIAALPRGKMVRKIVLPYTFGLAVLVATSGAVRAQVPAAGDTVRVATSASKVPLEFHELRQDTLVVKRMDGTLWGIPLAPLDRLEIGTRWSRSRTMVGYALGGAGVGASLGALIMAIGPCVSFFGAPCERPVLRGAATMGAIGAGVGLLIGAIRAPPWEWTPVNTDKLVARIAPRVDGLGVGLTLTPSGE